MMSENLLSNNVNVATSYNNLSNNTDNGKKNNDTNTAGSNVNAITGASMSPSSLLKTVTFNPPDFQTVRPRPSSVKDDDSSDVNEVVYQLVAKQRRPPHKFYCIRICIWIVYGL